MQIVLKGAGLLTPVEACSAAPAVFDILMPEHIFINDKLCMFAFCEQHQLFLEQYGNTVRIASPSAAADKYDDSHDCSPLQSA
jgi:hypothetical protein